MPRQIFQTDSRSRWVRFKWSIGVILTVAVLLTAVFVIMLIEDADPKFPFRPDYRSALSAGRPYMKKSALSRTYEGFRSYFRDRHQHSAYSAWQRSHLKKIQRFGGNTDRYIDDWTKRRAGIRAAFYVTWDPQSYASLKESLGKLNLVFPEWYFIDPSSGKLTDRTDAKGSSLLRKAGVPVMPVVSNAWNGEFRSAGVSRMLHSPILRRALIDSLLSSCLRHHYAGVNIDFEELRENSNEAFTAFVRALSRSFHNHGLYVTGDVASDNEDYDTRELAKYADYLVLMAYDEHNTLSAPGPVSSSVWIEKQTDRLASVVPPEKIILGIASYGYDWTADRENNQSISFHDAMSYAADSGASPEYDDDTYSLSFSYVDDIGMDHSVYFNDAATNFNTIRFGCEYPLAGFGVWRLGTEDRRLWKFYDRDLALPAAARYTTGDLEHIDGSKSATYLGQGEVLDLIGTPRDGAVHIDMDNDAFLIAEERYDCIPSAYELEKHGHCAPKDLLLTFDDGPDSRWTPKVLRILRKYNVHAAFFMVGLQMEKNLPLVRKVWESGNLIGNHTFTHHNIALSSPQRTYTELRLTRLLLECITGRSTILFRAPYNADSDPAGGEELLPLVEARKQNYIDVGESVDPNDWEPGVKANTIFSRVVRQVEAGTGHIILLHDAGGETREETVKALPRIISYFQSRGYHFITLDKYLGKNVSTLMPPIPKGREYYAMKANLTLASGLYEAGRVINALFLLFIILGFVRFAFMWILVIRERRFERSMASKLTGVGPERPRVSVIVPAYNEEVDAVASLENLLAQDYPDFDIIFVDDGSSDHTYERVSKAFAGNPKVSIFTKPNGGKASALNYGIARTDADYVVCIDADTRLRSNAIERLMRHFLIDPDGKIGAVAGSVKVGNEVNILTRWQAIEYTSSQNFDRMAYSAINAITVVPGAIGAYRRKAITDAGGLTTDTLAEDCDLTMRIIEAGYRVENENGAVALTEAPEKLSQFIRQRTRWCFGIMQTFWKNRGAMFRRRYRGLGLWALPNMLVFQFIIPTFSPLADLLMLLGIFTGSAMQVLAYYLIFLAVDASVSIMAYIHEKENPLVLFWIIVQRLVYRWIMCFVLFKSYIKAIRGELQSWGVLRRTGDVKTAAN